MIIVVLICTLIGYLCGSALIGLGVGLVLFAFSLWADDSIRYHRAPPARPRRRVGRRR